MSYQLGPDSASSHQRRHSQVYTPQHQLLNTTWVPHGSAQHQATWRQSHRGYSDSDITQWGRNPQNTSAHSAASFDDMLQWAYNTGLEVPKDPAQSFYEQWTSAQLASTPMPPNPREDILDAMMYGQPLGTPEGYFTPSPSGSHCASTYSSPSPPPPRTGYSSSSTSPRSSFHSNGTSSHVPSHAPLHTHAPSSRAHARRPMAATVSLTAEPRDPQRPFPCLHPGCNRFFTSKYTLKVHAQSHIPKQKVRLPCAFDGCPEDFSRQHDRLRHEVLQHGRVCEFVCSECQRFFSTNQTLQNHKCPASSGTRWALSA
ncbi:hypothetical protein FIBSPDRAFT_796262 [Athelia psychrophila]|uniref:C2H2-type domain-containing protein n=1 Tax=Athelia psychrophila TaxID=1759441 RepID=A0A166DRM7_9AGAM|nr:hypothetical protein FIBSPDRAFT_796262 [Fibularhizoctonia sp. CBS 109695]